jgi:hypothetical protein
VTIQPAPGQQPRQPAELPVAQPPMAVDPMAQAARPVEETHPAGQA